MVIFNNKMIVILKNSPVKNKGVLAKPPALITK